MDNMNKKGVLGDIMHVLIEITIIALIIGIFFFMAAKLYGAVFGGSSSKDTINNFYALTDNVQLMIDKPTSFEHQSMTFYLDEDHYVFGFQDRNTLSEYGRNPSVYPASCGDGPCLCLYKDLSSFPDKPVKCKGFPLNTNIIFHGFLSKQELVEHTWILNKETVTIQSQPTSYYYSDYPRELILDYQYLILGVSNDKSFWNLYVEKFVKNGRTHIFITSNLSQDDIDKRVSLLSVCPANSDPQCNNVPINSNTNIGSGFCYFDETQQKCVLKQGVTECSLDTKLTESCVCGSRFIDKQQWTDVYCHQRSSDNKYFALNFNCNDITTGCAGYCKSTSKDTDDCSSEEIDYCNQNPCGFGYSVSGNRCQVRQDGIKYYCEPAP